MAAHLGEEISGPLVRGHFDLVRQVALALRVPEAGLEVLESLALVEAHLEEMQNNL